MALNDLTATADQLRGYEAQFLARYTDGELPDVKRTEALQDLKYDLFRAHGTRQVSVIDAIAENHSEELTRALVFRQLHLMFVDETNGEGSVNEAKARYYRSAYEREAAAFRSMTNDGRASYQSTGIVL